MTVTSLTSGPVVNSNTGRHRPRIQYTYPPSPTSSGRSSPELTASYHRPSKWGSSGLTLAERLTNLKAELAALESELGEAQKAESPAAAEDDDEPVLVESEKTKKAERTHGHVDSGDLIKEMVDVKARLENINKLKETRTGREKLVSAVIQGVGERTSTGTQQEGDAALEKEVKEEHSSMQMEVKDIAEMDRRLGELERAVGSTTTAADEVYFYPL